MCDIRVQEWQGPTCQRLLDKNQLKDVKSSARLFSVKKKTLLTLPFFFLVGDDINLRLSSHNLLHKTFSLQIRKLKDRNILYTPLNVRHTTTPSCVALGGLKTFLLSNA